MSLIYNLVVLGYISKITLWQGFSSVVTEHKAFSRDAIQTLVARSRWIMEDLRPYFHCCLHVPNLRMRSLEATT